MNTVRSNNINLTSEQQDFINLALAGENVLVDACIGSGKTTSIQQLCNAYDKNKKILYLTYNKILKLDAKAKIKNKNCRVTNYDGFTWYELRSKCNIEASNTDCTDIYIQELPEVDKYDVLIIDEYQDIREKYTIVLNNIKKYNPKIQIISVGDMCQKIYDNTKLEVPAFIKEFMGDYKKLSFSKSFRINKLLGSELGKVWGKSIDGINEDCKVVVMTIEEVTDYLEDKSPGQILILGANKGDRVTIQNLWNLRGSKFNKSNVYSSIADQDKQVEPNGKCLISTTYDSAKGLERDICVVCDFTSNLYQYRQCKTKFEIIRNIFCVAASRGKHEIIFVTNSDKLVHYLYSEYNGVVHIDVTSLSNQAFDTECGYDFTISDMFDFKYDEDVVNAYNQLYITELSDENRDTSIIEIKANDGQIDLSPCIGIFQEAEFFKKYDIDMTLNFCKRYLKMQNAPILPPDESDIIEKKILYITAANTKQFRYYTEVDVPFITEEQKNRIASRLNTVFSGEEETQKICGFKIIDTNNKKYNIRGMTDAIKNGIIYELKFVNATSKTHFLQLACYLYALNKKEGILWNTKTNKMYSVSIPDRDSFVCAVLKAITKGEASEIEEVKLNID